MAAAKPECPHANIVPLGDLKRCTDCGVVLGSDGEPFDIDPLEDEDGTDQEKLK